MNKWISALLIILVFTITLSIATFYILHTSSPNAEQIKLTRVFNSTKFTSPLGIVRTPAPSGQLFIIEQAGTIKLLQKNTSGDWVSGTFLNITSRVLSGGEWGLLGLAFHPKYAENGQLYIYYTAPNPNRTVVARFTVNATDKTKVDINSEKILLEIPQPNTWHKAGQLAFGSDGYLYIGVGDGGPEGDPFDHGQDRSILLGKILRIDVDRTTPNMNYSIPPDNPYAGNKDGFREEIYAYGLRNPWRFSFDAETGLLWVGDVGQDRQEEIDLVNSGGNYGWNVMEGNLCYSETNCDSSLYEAPIYVYNHTQGNSAVIGGYVYRGTLLTGLQGRYIFGDYVSGRIWALTQGTNSTIQVSELVNSGLRITSFGIDDGGEIYLSTQDGQIYTLTK